MTQDTQTQAEIEKGDRRRFRAWPFIRAFWPCIVSMALLVVVVYMRRLDSLGDDGEMWRVYEELAKYVAKLRASETG